MQITAEWKGEQRFETGRPGGATATFDGRGAVGQSPMDALLSALAACSGIDVVDILTKRRTPPQRFTLEASGVRRETPPRRYSSIEVRFVIDGDGIEAIHAERAIALAFEKYCSVSASLAPDITIESTLVLNGASHPPVHHVAPAGAG